MDRVTFLSPPAKRQATSDPDFSFASSKRIKPNQAQPPLTVPPGHAAFRMLCHVSRIGALIGKSGSVIKQLQQSTGSKIRVEEAPVESPDRVITVIAQAASTSRVKLKLRNPSEGDGEGREEEFDVSKAQEALFRVFELILGAETVTGSVSCRLLAEASHAGAVIGKGGRVVEKMRKETGCKISVLTEKLPLCAEPGEEMVELEGDITAVKNALLAVSRCLQDCQPTKKLRMVGSRAPDKVSQETFHRYVDSNAEVTPRSPADFVSKDAFLRPVETVPQDALRRSIEMLSHDGFNRHVKVVSRDSFGRPIEAVSRDGFRRHIEPVSLDALCKPMEAFPQDALCRHIEAVPQVSLHGPIDMVSHDTFHRPSEFFPHDSMHRPVELFRRDAYHVPAKTVAPENLPDPFVDVLSHCNSVLDTTPGSSFGSALHIDSMSVKSSSLEPKTVQQKVVFKILCPTDTAGGVIGKGGAIIRALQTETGASISLVNALPDCDERVVTITASETPGVRYSPAQKAVVLVFTRSVEATIEKGLVSASDKGSGITARLVVPSNQVGCLLGKRGSTISEIRKATDTRIQIMKGDQNPRTLAEDEQVVQISGVFSNVKDALYHVTSRLRDDLFSSALSSTPTKSETPQITKLGTSVRSQDFSPMGLHSSVGFSQMAGRASNLDHVGFTHGFDRSPSPAFWASKVVAGPNSRSFAEVGRGLDTVKGGVVLGSRNKSALVTHITVEIRVPENVICSVYGENGRNLDKLRRISGAKVIVHEPHLGSSDRIIVISGTPDETQAAQTLLQAFILTG